MLQEIDERIYTHHLVEPPNPDSNLRRITFAMPRKLHSHDKKLIQERDDTFEWNNEFWESHNKKFFQVGGTVTEPFYFYAGNHPTIPQVG